MKLKWMRNVQNVQNIDDNGEHTRALIDLHIGSLREGTQ